MTYHHLAADRAWWRHLLGVLLIVVGWLVGGAVVYGVGGLAAPLSPRAALALDFAAVAVLLPVTWLATLVSQGRRPGTLSSVTGRLRWALLARCLVPSATVAAVLGAATLMVDQAPVPSAVASEVLRTLAALVLLVPVQAAAEEYVFRGYLLQAFGRLPGGRRPPGLRVMSAGPWPAILAQAVLFAAAHGWGTPWGFIDLVLFGVVGGWLTVRTGGLEAAIALHALNNLAAVALLALAGDLRLTETAADLPWQLVAIDVPVMLLYAFVMARLARRWGQGRRSGRAHEGVGELVERRPSAVQQTPDPVLVGLGVGCVEHKPEPGFVGDPE